MPTPHNQAQPGEIANVVLMPGDPLRAKYIAQTYLENPKCFNSVRNMLGYTGSYKGKKVSVMGSGMGMPSIGIYSYELFDQYGVDTIIRIGSAGGYTDDLHVFDLVLAKDAWSNSTYAKEAMHEERDVLAGSKKLNQSILDTAKDLGIDIKEDRIHSSDVFYCVDDSAREAAKAHGAKAVEMESFALFANAKQLNKNAACICTISDSFVHDEITTPEQREKNFDNMIRLALEVAAKEAA